MAVDTYEKRFAVMGMALPWMPGFPTGTIDEEERLSIAFAYGGNALTPAAPGGDEGRFYGGGFSEQIY